MRVELGFKGEDVQFLAVNKGDAADTQAKLVEKCAYPLFQDTPEVNAWGLHGGSKDDFFVYDSTGHLAAYLPIAGGVTVDLSTPEGYQNLMNAILAAD